MASRARASRKSVCSTISTPSSPHSTSRSTTFSPCSGRQGGWPIASPLRCPVLRLTAAHVLLATTPSAAGRVSRKVGSATSVRPNRRGERLRYRQPGWIRQCIAPITAPAGSLGARPDRCPSRPARARGARRTHLPRRPRTDRPAPARPHPSEPPFALIRPHRAPTSSSWVARAAPRRVSCSCLELGPRLVPGQRCQPRRGHLPAGVQANRGVRASRRSPPQPVRRRWAARGYGDPSSWAARSPARSARRRW